MSTLTNCSNALNLNSEQTTNTLPTRIDIGQVFNFKQFPEDNDNTIYPNLSDSKLTSGFFISKPNEKKIVPLLDQYVNEEYVGKNWLMNELTIPEADITATSLIIKPLPSSVHFNLTSSVKVYYPSLSSNYKKPIGDIPGLLLSYQSPYSYAEATVETVKEAIKQNNYFGKVDLNQINISTKNSTDWKQLNSYMFYAKITAKTDSNLYQGSANVKIVQSGLTLDELISQKDIGVNLVSDYSQNLTLSQVTDGLSIVNFNTVDETVIEGLEIQAQNTTDTYQRKVTLKVKYGSALSEVVDPESTIDVNAYAVKNGDLFVKILYPAGTGSAMTGTDWIDPFNTFNNCYGSNGEINNVFSFPQKVNDAANPCTKKSGVGSDIPTPNLTNTLVYNIIGYNNNVQGINFTATYQGVTRTLDMSNCHFPNLKLLEVYRSPFRTIKFPRLNEFNADLYNFGVWHKWGMYISYSDPNNGISGIWNFYIADVVAKDIYISTRKSVANQQNTAAEHDWNVYLPTGSGVVFKGCTWLDYDWDNMNPTYDPTRWRDGFKIKFNYSYTYN